MWNSITMLKKLYRGSRTYHVKGKISYIVKYTPPYVTIATPFHLKQVWSYVPLVFFGLNWPRSAPMTLDYQKRRTNLTLTHFEKYEKVNNKCIVMYIENITDVDIDKIQNWIDANTGFDIIIFSDKYFELGGVNVISTQVLFNKYINLDELLSKFAHPTQDTIYARIDITKHLTFRWCLDKDYEFVFYTDYGKVIPETIPEFAFECCKKCGILYAVYNMSGTCEDHVYLIHNSAKYAVIKAFESLLKDIKSQTSVNMLRLILNHKLLIRVFKTYEEIDTAPENIYLLKEKGNYEEEIQNILKVMESITFEVNVENKFLKNNIKKIKSLITRQQ